MSSAVPIPGRSTQQRHASSSAGSSASSSAASPSSLYWRSASWSADSPFCRRRVYSNGKGKEPASSSPSERDEGSFFAQRRPSLMGSSLSKSEHTVIHLGSSDGAPRLVTCVKSSQGFDWNPELFLPSYANHDLSDFDVRQEPVREIVLTEEEAAALLPR